MAAYPSLRMTRESTTERDGGQQPARATNGALRLRRLYSADKASMTLEHVLSDAERTTLEAFYQANKDLAITFKWPEGDATVYSAMFVAAPQYTRMPGWWRARVRLMEV